MNEMCCGCLCSFGAKWNLKVTSKLITSSRPFHPTRYLPPWASDSSFADIMRVYKFDWLTYLLIFGPDMVNRWRHTHQWLAIESYLVVTCSARTHFICFLHFNLIIMFKIVTHSLLFLLSFSVSITRHSCLVQLHASQSFILTDVSVIVRHTSSLVHSCWCFYCYSAPVWVWSIAINQSVCVSVCSRASLELLNRSAWNLCAYPLWPWLGAPLAALHYVMYFRFYGRHQVWS